MSTVRRSPNWSAKPSCLRTEKQARLRKFGWMNCTGFAFPSKVMMEMAGLNHQVCGVLDLAGAAHSPDDAFLQRIPIKMKTPTSVRKVMLIIATVRNTSLAERGCMNASHLAKPQG
jgi:hypothetical protein